MSGLWTNIQRVTRVPSAAMRGMRAAKEATYTVVDAAGIERRAEIVSQSRRWPWRRTLPHKRVQMLGPCRSIIKFVMPRVLRLTLPDGSSSLMLRVPGASPGRESREVDSSGASS